MNGRGSGRRPGRDRPIAAAVLLASCLGAGGYAMLADPRPRLTTLADLLFVVLTAALAILVVTRRPAARPEQPPGQADAGPGPQGACRADPRVERLTTLGMLVAGSADEVQSPLAGIVANVDNLVLELPKVAESVRRCSSAVRMRMGDAAFADTVGVEGQEALGPDTFDELVTSARDALAGALRLRQLTHRLAAFLPFEKSALEMVDLRRLLDGVIEASRGQVELPARLETDFGEVPMVPASSVRLSQVFLNLLTNAAQALPRGPSGRIAIRTRADGQYACVEIEDNGGGITPQVLPHLFEPFFTTKGQRLGLGLALCKSVVGELNGDIEVRSRAGRGACFVVRLPHVTAPPEAPSRPATVEQARGRVLVIDDEEGIRWALHSLLHRQHEVVLSSSGSEARTLLEHDRAFDVVLCDLMMPDIPGSDLHRWLRDLDPALAGRFVFITGGAFTARTEGYTAQLDNPTVEKPFDPAQLVLLVSRLVSEKRSCLPGGA